MARSDKFAGLVAGLLAAFLLAAFGCGGKGATASGPAQELRVVYTSNGAGEIAPCG